MKISIITVCFNAASTLGDAMDSVAAQTYQDVEHIVIDGGSTDGSIEMLSAGRGKVALWKSEPDQGLYDAMNKGIALATGDIIGFLNADDLYADTEVLSNVADTFNRLALDAMYADLVYVSQTDVNKVVRYWQSSVYVENLFKQGWMPPHPTFFARREVYARYGRFNLSYRIAADFELMFRLMAVHRIRVQYLPKVLIRMRLGGTTNKNPGNVIRQNREIMRVLRLQYPEFSAIRFIGHKIINRSLQFLRRPNR